MMRPQKLRPLQIADMLILIGGVAVAVALIRRQWDLSFSEYLQQSPPLEWTPGSILGRLIMFVAYLGVYAGAVAAVTFLAIRLRGPRPPRRRLTTQPGLAACAAITLVIALSEVEYLVRVSLLGVNNPFRWGFSFETFLVLMDGVIYSFHRNGYAVAAAWLTLAIGRRWRPSRAGSTDGDAAIGIFWLLTIPLYALIHITGRF